MSADTLFVFIVLGAAAVLFATNRVRVDLVALLVVLTLMLSGVLSVRESISGFGDPIVLLIASLFVVGEGLVRTGIANQVGDWLQRTGGTSETKQITLMTLAAAGLGAVMSSTAVVAILIPVVMRVAGRVGLRPSRLLMPMAYGALISGMMTLIGTAPNLVVDGELTAKGHRGFGFFDFTPIGLAVLAVLLVYMLLFGRRMLGSAAAPAPGRVGPSVSDLVQKYDLEDRVRFVRLEAGSDLVGRTPEELGLRGEHGVNILGIERRARLASSVVTALARRPLEVDDVLLVEAAPESLAAFLERDGVSATPPPPAAVRRWGQELGLAEVLLPPDSELVDTTLRKTRFRTRHGVGVAGVRRRQHVLDQDLSDVRLAVGDALLVVGPWERIRGLSTDPQDFLLMSLPTEQKDAVPAPWLAPIAVGILAAMVILLVVTSLPAVAVATGAAIVMVAARCLSMEDAYRAIDWKSLVLIAGLLPMATALERTGGLDLIVNGLLGPTGRFGPYAVLSAFLLGTALLSSFLSNTATAVVMAPVAIRAAADLDIAPQPLAMGVAIGASAAYITPIASPIVTLVAGPGGYRFGDYMKVGIPMLILTWLVALVVIPLLFPF